MPIDLNRAANKFKTRGQAAATDYAEGVRGAGPKWQAATEGSADNYNAGVQAAIADNRFQRGVSRAGAAGYESKATGVGAQRFPQGIASAGPDWQRGFAPIAQAMDGVTPPPRRPRGDPSNIDRVRVFNEAARRAKIGR